MEAYQNKDFQYASYEENRLDSIDTGRNDKNAYGVVVRHVNTIRAGREGNSALC